jgi:hypothetical protein
VTVNNDPVTGLYGIDWHVNIPNTGEQQYSVTFAGDVPLGVAGVALRSGSTRGSQAWYGPCGDGLFDASGKVFVDADTDQAIDTGESGLANVTVELRNAAGNSISAKTAPDGSYGFGQLLPGTYTLRVPAATPAADFNETLVASFSSTTSLPLSLTGGPNAPGNDIGFDAQTQKLIKLFDDGTISTEAEAVGFWVKAVRDASNGSNKASPAIQSYLNTIEGLFYPDPFQFDDSDELQAALNILKNNSKAPIDQLLKELLATELNQVSGRGITGGDDGLLLALIAWGEAVVVANQGGASSSAAGKGAEALEASATSLSTATSLFRAINGGGGGGTGGGNE